MLRGSLFRSYAVLVLGIVFFTSPGRSAPAGWTVPDAPYRAIIHVGKSPAHPEDGALITLPDFGQSLPEGRDLLLLGKEGDTPPIKVVPGQPGGEILLLAGDLKEGADYTLYFGGGMARLSPTWDPKISLLLEVRTVAPTATGDSWAEIEKLWNRTREVAGGKFLENIFQAGNPFGVNEGFVSHITGWLLPPKADGVFLYTVSSDASFVLVNGKFGFDWPGRHSPVSNRNDVHGKEFPVTGEPLRIDYYQIKASDSAKAAMVLGWEKEGKLETIPASAWAHPGPAEITALESASGDPIPLAEITPISCLGYADHWFSLVNYRLRAPLPVGWTIQWEFEDGTQSSEPAGKHVFTDLKPQTVKVTLRSGRRTVTGTRRVMFSDSLPQLSVNKAQQRREYLNAIAAGNPAGMKPGALAAQLALVLDYEKDPAALALAEAYLPQETKGEEPTTLRATLAWLRGLAQTDPHRARTELQRVDPQFRQKHFEDFGEFEMDLLAFNLRDPSAADRALSLAGQRRGTDFERLMKLRAADASRILGQTSQAIAGYQAATGQLDLKQLPVSDHASSMKIAHDLKQGNRDEARQTLKDWELHHPMAKFQSDFLLLHARALLAFGRNREALTEIESFEKILPDDPLEIEAEFLRARCLDALGQKEEAKNLRADLVRKYPRHPLSAPDRQTGDKKP